MQVYGQINNEQYTYFYFYLTVIDPCPYIVITPDTVTTPQQYDIWRGTTLTLASTSGWSKNITVCPLAFHLVDTDNPTNLDSIFPITGSNV